MNDALFRRAERVLPGGVTAAARANPALGQPFYMARGDGAYVVGEDGRRYIETCMSNGGTLLGHGHPAIVAAVREAAARGFVCAYDGEPQVRLAERLVEIIPSFEQVRFTTTGTEATYYTTRIARAYTGRPLIVKFAGHFHGFNDALAFNFPRGGDTAVVGSPRAETAGMTPGAESGVIVIPFNDPAALTSTLAEHGDRIAAVVMEPINYDAGAIAPFAGYIELARDETRRRGILLVFDEILSGFRTGPGGAQEYLGVTPDLTALGKALAGGIPLSAFGGRRDVMSVVAPLGPAVHTGTYNAHLVPTLAAHAFLDTIAVPGFWPRLLGLHERLTSGLSEAFTRSDLPVRVQCIGARFAMYFGLDSASRVETYAQAAGLDRTMMNAFCREMHARGVYVNPAWHHGISAMHTEADIDAIVAAAGEAARSIARTTVAM
ncbi:MAG: aminotransferase class III-fold pyridoxal phosphate-dependent enzyme [Chloroflexota bacterium]|nr:MAG: aminotransferase class III-fold pyridoxal phosphate-dependent enzyme [Chloroflexota bacterium]